MLLLITDNLIIDIIIASIVGIIVIVVYAMIINLILCRYKWYRKLRKGFWVRYVEHTYVNGQYRSCEIFWVRFKRKEDTWVVDNEQQQYKTEDYTC